MLESPIRLEWNIDLILTGFNKVWNSLAEFWSPQAKYFVFFAYYYKLFAN